MKKASILSLLLAAALALSLTGCELPWKLGKKEPVGQIYFERKIF